MLSCVWLALLLTLPTAPTEHFREPRGAKISPRQGLGPLLSVRLWTWIDDPTEDMYCPSVEVIVSNGADTLSARQEGDCDPWDGDTTRTWSYSRWYRLSEGDYTFEVTLTQGKKRLHFGDLRVTVH
jgi:hypothetical protein